jgi:hypothetical protein
VIQDIKDFWAMIEHDKFARSLFFVILALILVLIVYVIYKGVTTPKSTFIPSADSVVTRQDTVAQLNVVEDKRQQEQSGKAKDESKSEPKIEAKNVFQGGSGNTYQEKIHVGDNVVEPELSEEEKKEFIRYVKQLISEKNFNGVGLWVSPGSNGGKILSQIKEILFHNKMEIRSEGISLVPSEGISFTKQLDYLLIIVGRF